MKILVIRYKFIGDVLMTSVICNSLKKTFPAAQVDYMVHDISAPLFANHPYIDNVIPVSMAERKNPWRYWQTVRAVAKQRYDIIIDASSIEKTKLISLLSPQAQYRIGRQKKWRGMSYTHSIAKTAEQGDKITQRLGMLAPLQAAGIELVLDDTMCLNISDAEKHSMRQHMLEQGVDFQKPILAFSVSAKFTQKKWRTDYMQRVAQHCLDHYGAQIILYAGAPHELLDIHQFHQNMGQHPAIFSTIKTRNIRDLATLFANCHMFIGNEGGPRHISQALGLPSVAVFSPSADRGAWLPCQSQKYRGIEWRDVVSNQPVGTVDFEYGDSTYFKLYNSITPEHVIPVVDELVQHYLPLDGFPATATKKIVSRTPVLPRFVKRANICPSQHELAKHSEKNVFTSLKTIIESVANNEANSDAINDAKLSNKQEAQLNNISLQEVCAKSGLSV